MGAACDAVVQTVRILSEELESRELTNFEHSAIFTVIAIVLTMLTTGNSQSRLSAPSYAAAAHICYQFISNITPSRCPGVLLYKTMANRRESQELHIELLMYIRIHRNNYHQHRS
jgi:hypothetical protein